MRSHRRFQRILFLCLFSASVIAPIVFLSRGPDSISSLGRNDFIEDISAAKHGLDVLKLRSMEQEEGQTLKEPQLVVYEDKTFDSVSNDSASDKIDGDFEDSIDAGDKPEVQRNGTSMSSSKEYQQIQQKVLPETTEGKENLTRTLVQHTRKAPTRGPTDKKVQNIKDQLVRARAYMTLIPPGSNSHLVKELRLRMRELERALGDARNDSDLLRSAWQRSRAMESSLTKAARFYSDCSTMASKLRAMTYNAEEQVQTQKNQADYLLHLAARTTPKGLHCLTMRLTAEYFALMPEERKFGNQEKVHDQGLFHHAVFSDNVLACAVVVNSTVSSALDPEKIVIHIVTDFLNYPAISMWFLLNPPAKVTLDIRSMQDFEWLSHKHRSALEKHNSPDPRYTSALNHLRFYLPDVFPLLNKMVLLDHDVVVRRDLGELWNVNMMGKVNGAVQTCQEGAGSYRQMDKFINFSDPFVSERFDPNTCTWAFGMNLFDLQEWRRQNLTAIYGSFLQMNGRGQLSKAGSLPLGWLTFYNQMIPLDKRWHMLGLGYDSGIGRHELEQAAVIHYDGLMKPWLEIGIGKYKGYWRRYLSYDHPYMQQCNIHE